MTHHLHPAPLLVEGCLGFADGGWPGSVLAGDDRSAISYLILVHDLWPHIVPWYKQTSSDNSGLQSCLGDRNTAWPGRVLCSSLTERIRADAELGTGAQEQLEGEGEGCSGDQDGLMSEAINLVPCSSSSIKIDAAKKGKKKNKGE